MLSILLVDDEELVLDMLCEKVQWSVLGIEQVYTAKSMRQALDVFSANKIDILLCDIEMPQGSGLELLRYLIEMQVDVVSILLTAHADFKYAKEAVSLGAIEYVVKPAPISILEDVISRAVQRALYIKTESDFVDRGKRWTQSSRTLQEHFWLENLRSGADRGAMEAAHAKLRTEKYLQRYYDLLQAMIHFPSDDRSGLSQSELSFSIENILRELTNAEGVVSIIDNTWLCIFPANTGITKLTEMCERIIDTLEQHQHTTLVCGLMMNVPPEEIAGQSRNIWRTIHNGFDNKSIIVFSGLLKHEDTEYAYCKPSFESWRSLLRAGQRTVLQTQVSDYLKELSLQRVVPERVLSCFLHDFLQILYGLLEGVGIQSAQLINDDVHRLLRCATQGISDMNTFCQLIIERADDLLNSHNHVDTLSERIIRYVKANVDKDVSRERIADFLELSPEHVSRVFKQETGVNLVNYLQTVRLDIACDWLMNTKLTISDIAMQLGYGNFAYFS